MLDCSSPAVTGYAFTGYMTTTYASTASVTCAAGYDGSATPSAVTCLDTGSWTTVSGCTIKGKTHTYTHMCVHKHMHVSTHMRMFHVSNRIIIDRR